MTFLISTFNFYTFFILIKLFHQVLSFKYYYVMCLLIFTQYMH